ncbi:bifunctional protein tyrosine phosphatase family protein/NAD(P)/FAD-dependent oxidoreductase [Bordetella sp. FB-8]|uniref:bifunctional protein tyrosine phosphatase family protein/NAD(P)/FAD-dependent oxidoreductase n=1 Tax=Bordetella sp. FB-8 TaxID=1159870 RepID=UPI00037B520C|nr:bifunctional protein tyrosine phosphatase family protein/NAD(P)/FAD-dependent oxidoreductase [Bordetella sp. FB-8]
MDTRILTPELSVSPQIFPQDVAALRTAGFRALICNRPDGEGNDQPLFSEIEKAARAAGMDAVYMPVESGKVTDEQARQFGEALARLPRPVLAYCRTGMRSATMWALSQTGKSSLTDILESAQRAGYDMSAVTRRIANAGSTALDISAATHDVVVVGGGAAGIAVTASMLSRNPGLDVVIIDPADVHYYQPGWTLVGRGIFQAPDTARTMGSLIPRGAQWIKSAVAAFDPQSNSVILDGCRVVRYKQLVVCPGLKLDWGGIEGLAETLGSNGVTSNYRYDLAPYTWKRVQSLRGGRALFTQPPMPIKCAGAPQKAMYLSADHWRRQGVLRNIDIGFYNSGAALFGVAEYVPALMEYVKAYGIDLNFGHTLTSIDGPGKTATFVRTGPDGSKETVRESFDMIHVVPPQKAPDFIRVSPLADAAGWVDIDPATMRHKQYENIHALGDAGNTGNAKTAAAARAQAPVVAHNVLAALGLAKGQAQYNGYGSCPLTVERGKIVLAEFLYGGKVAPSFPTWLIDGTRPSRLAWLLKERILPFVYWKGMFKGHEWMVHPKLVDVADPHKIREDASA